MSVPALAQVQVGIQRPLITEDPRVYDDFSFITTEDFNKSGDGLTVKFYQSPELEATLAVDDLAESGYATSNLRYRGEGYTVDYVWKIQCADYVTDKTIKGSEGYTFGFDLTVADGCSFTVSALELDLLLEQNPSWRIRIVDANDGELYNSTWVTETGGYNSAEWGAGWYGRFILTTLESLGLKNEVELDLTLARGLNYYTGAIFEVKALDVQIGSITGGGRYDNLTGVFGMPGVSGVGISFGADRIFDVLNQLDLYPKEAVKGTQLLFINFGQCEAAFCLSILSKARAAGIRAEIYPDNAKMKKQMSYANAKGVPYVALVGENEMHEGKVTLKDMATGEQRLLTPDELIEALTC